MQKASTWFGQALEMQFKENILGQNHRQLVELRINTSSIFWLKFQKNNPWKNKKIHRKVQRSFNSIKEFSRCA